MSPRLPVVRPREVVRALERAGWLQTRQRGSHLSVTKEGSRSIVSVPMYNRDIKRGTLSGILEDAGLSIDEFIELLRGKSR